MKPSPTAIHAALLALLVTALVGCQDPPQAPRVRTSPPRVEPARPPDAHYPVLAPLAGDLNRPAPFEGGPAEPSGGAWIEELGGFLVVDDESTVGGQRGLYFLTLAGAGGPQWLPVSLADDAEGFRWDDLEAVAASPDRVVWLASHAHNSAWRQRICHAPRKGLSKVGQQVSITGTRCTPGRQSREAILAALADLAPGRSINLEGLAWSPGEKTFYVGLREPLAGRAAILLRMDPNFPGSMRAPRFQLGRTVNLEGRGVRGMTFLDENRLLLAAGPEGDEPGRYDLYLADLGGPQAQTKISRLTPQGFPPRAPDGREIRIEGLAFDGQGLLVLSDSGWWRDDGTVGAHSFYFRLR